MKDREMQNLWKSLSNFEWVKFDKSMLHKEVKQQCTVMEKQIKQRNRLEILVAVMLMPMAGMVAFLHQDFMVKTGALLMFPYLFTVIYKLLKVRKSRPMPESFVDNKTFIHQNLTYYNQEKNLLETVAVWYVMPAVICVSLILIGIGISGFKLYYSFAIVIGMAYLIIRVNKQAVSKKLNPLIDRLERELQQSKESSD